MVQLTDLYASFDRTTRAWPVSDFLDGADSDERPLSVGFFSFKKSAWLCMDMTRFQENKGEQVTSLKAKAQTSPITSVSLLWPKQVEKPIQMTGIKKLTPHLKGRRNKSLWPVTQNYCQGLTVERASVSI